MSDDLKKKTQDQLEGANDGPKFEVKIELIKLNVIIKETSLFRVYLRNQIKGQFRTSSKHKYKIPVPEGRAGEDTHAVLDFSDDMFYRKETFAKDQNAEFLPKVFVLEINCNEKLISSFELDLNHYMQFDSVQREQKQLEGIAQSFEYTVEIIKILEDQPAHSSIKSSSVEAKMALEPTSQKTVESTQAAADLANGLNSITENSEEDATSAAHEMNSQSSAVNDQEKDVLRQEVLKLQRRLQEE